MAIQTLHDTGETYPITPKMDGGTYGTGISDCICKGIGDEFTISYSSNSLNIQFEAGSQAVIGGAFFRVMSLEAITLVANSTIYLCANIDLSRPNGSTGAFVQRTASNMQSDNLNGSGVSRDMLLYVITTGANGVTNVEDRRVIRGDGTSAVGGVGLSVTADTYGKYFTATNLASNNTVGLWYTKSNDGRYATVTDSSENMVVGIKSKDLEVYASSYKLAFKVLTQSQYDSLSTKDGNTLYFVTEN